MGQELARIEPPIPPPKARFWKAAPHQWGPGKIHVIREDGVTTLCGLALKSIPGHYIPAVEYDCKACAQAVIVREKHEKQEREWKARLARWDAEREERERERAEENRRWWAWFRAYLESPAWAARRRAVLSRARGCCEACGWRPATQVHHLTYDHVGNEPLWELRAICKTCHDPITEQDRRRRAAAYGPPRT